MVRNKEKFEQAKQFRKRGFTYSEIAKICDVSKATVSNWLKNEAFSQQITITNTKRAAKDNQKRMQLLNKARKAERSARYREALRSAQIEYSHYKKDPHFMAGLMVYVSLGDTSLSSKIRLTSTRADAHRVFITFCKAYLGVEQKDIQFWILLSGKTSIESATRWWSKQIGIPFARFGKPQFVNPTQKTLHKGSGNTIIGNTVLKKKLLRWLELASKEFKK